VAQRSGLMFGEMARYYDLLYGAKDYRTESRKLVALARRYGRSAGRSWLDVACGTGRHLEFLRRQYSVVGVDRSPQMLRVARKRLPGVRLVRGDMRSFRLGARFDVLSCLFSAIGHLTSEDDLRRTFENFSDHLEPGGVMIVEPWIDPADFVPGTIHAVTYRTPELIVVRVAFSARRGNRTRIRYHYLVAERGRGIRHFQELDIGLGVSRQKLLGTARAAGLRARFVDAGFATRRGLIIGVKPLAPRRGR
jgi:ubiquinone/menaquinone biosynthesis C-methylase UbiE